MSHDKEYYIFESKLDGGGIRQSHYHWTELCLSLIPQKLGVNYLIIPIKDPDYNLADYLVDYYNEMFIREQEVSHKAGTPPKLEIIRNFADIPQALVNVAKRRNNFSPKLIIDPEEINEEMGRIISIHN